MRFINFHESLIFRVCIEDTAQPDIILFIYDRLIYFFIPLEKGIGNANIRIRIDLIIIDAFSTFLHLR